VQNNSFQFFRLYTLFFNIIQKKSSGKQCDPVEEQAYADEEADQNTELEVPSRKEQRFLYLSFGYNL